MRLFRLRLAVFLLAIAAVASASCTASPEPGADAGSAVDDAASAAAPDGHAGGDTKPTVDIGVVADGAGGSADAVDIRDAAAVDVPDGPDDAAADVEGVPAVAVVSVDGDWGDVQLSVRLSPADGGRRDLTITWTGVCAAGRSWPATTSGSLRGLGVATHSLTWHTWDDLAGCEGEVALTVRTDRGEVSEPAPLFLRNVGDRAGFVSYPQTRQGVNEDEVARWEHALSVLVPHPGVDFVATRRGDDYEVHAARGSVTFRRTPTNRGYRYDVVEVVGTDPIGNQDPSYGSSFAQELALGSNPNDVALPDAGYARGDRRLSFVEPEDDSYPFGYERIAAWFDHPDAADFYVERRGYAHGEIGSHGSLNAAQSRAPLLLWGAGVSSGVVHEPSRLVDIAPTVARLLGVPAGPGVDERGVRSHAVHLAWQDGHVLEAALDGVTAGHVIVFVLDGLSHSELEAALSYDPENIPHLARLQAEGAWLRWGSIAGWPSVTFPGHNVVGSGLWNGHHGLVDNVWYRREDDMLATPHADWFDTERYWAPALPEGETLHMALHRAFGEWSEAGDGVYTAALMDPSVRGADTADMEARDRSGRVPFPLAALTPAPDLSGPNVPPTDGILLGQQMAEALALTELHLLFDGPGAPRPRYVIVGFSTTDGCGEAYGPHGDRMEAVLRHIDEGLGSVLGWLEGWGILDDTAIVITADHGMQVGDPSRTSDPLAALDDAGIDRVPDTGHGVWLR